MLVPWYFQCVFQLCWLRHFALGVFSRRLQQSQQIFLIVPSFSLEFLLTEKAPHSSPELSFLFCSFCFFFCCYLKDEPHALPLALGICPIKERTFTLGFDDLQWHNFKLLLGLIICQQIITSLASQTPDPELQTVGSKNLMGKIVSSKIMEWKGPLPFPTLFGQVNKTAS